MESVNKVSAAEVLSALQYDKDPGEFRWKRFAGGNAKAGSLAGGIDSKGYRQIKIGGKLYLAHRLVWLCEYGEFPQSHIDHIDRNPLNNRISNLRLCTRSQNQQNVGLRKSNTSGHAGVSFVKASNKWLAYISLNTKRIRIGLFDKFEDAVAARKLKHAELHPFGAAGLAYGD